MEHYRATLYMGKYIYPMGAMKPSQEQPRETVTVTDWS